MYITTQGIRFDIITTKDEIIFKDEVGGTLTWCNTIINRLLVEDMVAHICTVKVSSTASALSIGAVA